MEWLKKKKNSVRKGMVLVQNLPHAAYGFLAEIQLYDNFDDD